MKDHKCIQPNDILNLRKDGKTEELRQIAEKINQDECPYCKRSLMLGMTRDIPGTITTYEKEQAENFELLNITIEKEKDPKKKARLKTFKDYCVAEMIIPEAVASYEDYRDWHIEKGTDPLSLMTIREWHAFQQDIDDSKKE